MSPVILAFLHHLLVVGIVGLIVCSYMSEVGLMVTLHHRWRSCWGIMVISFWLVVSITVVLFGLMEAVPRMAEYLGGKAMSVLWAYSYYIPVSVLTIYFFRKIDRWVFKVDDGYMRLVTADLEEIILPK